MHMKKAPKKSLYTLALALLISTMPGFGLYAQSADNTASLRDLQGEASEGDSQQSTQVVDGIAAVVNKNVITLRQLATEVDAMRQQMQSQNIPVPDQE